jgi:hypothetical protein
MYCPSISRFHTPRLGDFLLNSNNFSLLCDFCRFHRLVFLNFITIWHILMAQCKYPEGPHCAAFSAFLSMFFSKGQINILCSFLKMAWQVSSLLTTKYVLNGPQCLFFPYNERPRFVLLLNSGQNYKSCIFRRVRKIAKSDYQLRHVCLSVCPLGKNSALTERIFKKFDI